MGSLCHFERHDLHFALIRINNRGQDYAVPLVSFYYIWVADAPVLAVLVAHKYLAVVADFAFYVNCFGRVTLGRVSLHAVVVHGVLCRSHSQGQQGDGETESHQ